MLQEYNLKKSKDPIMDSEFDTSMRKFNLNHSNFSIAVSGGPDSMALSILLSRYSKLNSIDLHALIVDHKIRDESSEEAILVSEKLNQLPNCELLRMLTALKNRAVVPLRTFTRTILKIRPSPNC